MFFITVTTEQYMEQRTQLRLQVLQAELQLQRQQLTLIEERSRITHQLLVAQGMKMSEGRRGFTPEEVIVLTIFKLI